MFNIKHVLFKATPAKFNNTLPRLFQYFSLTLSNLLILAFNYRYLNIQRKIYARTFKIHVYTYSILNIEIFEC